jgi:lysophospholipase L1-like esterase
VKIQKIIGPIIVVFLLAFLTFLVLQQAFPKAQPRLNGTRQVATEKYKETIRYTALGDSLTEGVGDDTKRGGFVPIVANDLQEEFQLISVEVENYGVAGERSDQIYKRLKKETEIQNNMAESDIITLTVGGNDLMKVIQNNIFGLSMKTFEKPLKKYQTQLTELLTELRNLNPHAPIYVVGVYNPFYVNFPEITDMQTIVDNWNEGTKEIVEENENVYFIPINELIASGLGEPAITVQTEDSSIETGNDLNIVKNNVLYDKDKFHPNNIGYQLMAKAVKDELISTKNEWLLKESE